MSEPRLLDRVRGQIRVRHMKWGTEKAYVGWIRRYILFHSKRHPAEMGAEEISAFLTHLATKERVSASTQNQALCALIFLYKHVIGHEVGELENLVRAKRRRRIPVVLTRDEVREILRRVQGVPWIVLTLLYGQDYAAYHHVLLLLMVAGAIRYASLPMGTALKARGRFWRPLPIHGLAIGLVALACALRIPSLGLVGAAHVVLATAIFEAAAYFVLALVDAEWFSGETHLPIMRSSTT